MSIWGKVLGGAAGMTLGGPLGGLLGGLAGHAVDKLAEGGRTAGADDEAKRIAFTSGMIVLAAKMAKADGVVTEDEIGAFKKVFRIPRKDMKSVSRLFEEAQQDGQGFEPYARQIGRIFGNNPAVLEELLDGLIHIAQVDGRVTVEEQNYLGKLTEIFGLYQTRWERIRTTSAAPEDRDPFAILGLRRKDGDKKIKRVYLKLVREHHPDKLIAEGMPQEFIDLANDKLATINAAYDDIRKERDPT